MGLIDRYNRGGDSRLELLDRYLTHLGDRAGNFWRDRTGASRTVLTQSLYHFAAWAAMQQLVLAHDPTMLVIVGISLLALRGVTRTRGGPVEQIQAEALGLPRRTFVILRLWLLGVGMLSLAIAVGDLAVTLQTRSPLPLDATKSLLVGCALIAWQIGDYISRSNPIWPSGGARRRA
jgi:hypothetical protein